MRALFLLETCFLCFRLLSCAPLPDLGLTSAETAKSDDAILLKLEEDFTCPITQVSLASTAPCMLCVTALNIKPFGHCCFRMPYRLFTLCGFVMVHVVCVQDLCDL